VCRGCEPLDFFGPAENHDDLRGVVPFFFFHHQESLAIVGEP
jgi:hypothetical protein